MRVKNIGRDQRTGEEFDFPIEVVMREKLRQLHAKKMVFWNMCDPDKRADSPR